MPFRFGPPWLTGTFSQKDGKAKIRRHTSRGDGLSTAFQKVALLRTGNLLLSVAAISKALSADNFSTLVTFPFVAIRRGYFPVADFALEACSVIGQFLEGNGLCGVHRLGADIALVATTAELGGTSFTTGLGLPSLLG